MVAAHSVKTERFLLFLILAGLAARAALVFSLNINWDEFFYLSHIYGYERGELAVQLQMFHVHLLGWLTSVSGNEVDQILAARVLMLALSAVSTALIFLVARVHFPRAIALLCALAYVCFSEVVRHGASFRADSLYTPLVLAAAYLAMKPVRSPGMLVLGGAGTALALMITIKAALFLPTIGALFFIRIARAGFTRESLRPAAIFTAALLVAFGILFAVHDALLPALKPDVDVALVERSLRQTILETDLFPRWRTAIGSVMRSLLSWLAIFAGIVIAVYGVARWRWRASLRDLDVLCLVLPLSTIAFYRNAFPYFYVTLAAFAVIAGGVAVAWLLERCGRRINPAAILSFCGILLTGVLALGIANFHTADEIRGERALLAAIHRTFPEPVPYIDRCSMVSSFPKVGLFMSAWGMDNYRAAGQPVMMTLIERKQPRFLIVNTEALNIAASYDELDTPQRYRLLRQDFETLKDNFIPHWGPLFVAGKTLVFDGETPSREVEILIAGTYTVEGAPLVVDGRTFGPGTTVKLDKGRHRMAAIGTPSTVVLRWGDHLYRPKGEPPTRLFTGL